MPKKTIAMYIRLSMEDGDLDFRSKKESNSITTQRMLLQGYIAANPELSLYHIEEFCDDGYTGTNFDRPAFQAMLRGVKEQRIDCIIVKDLSRFGREYLDVSSYLERIFPISGTRFISVNDHFDSNDYIGTTGGMELAFRNLINAMYSKDLSVKAKSARKTRAKKGEYLGGHPFYGYLKDPLDPHHLIVDEAVRDVVERIYSMCMEGYSTMAIAKILNDENIPCPAEYKRQRGIRYNKPTKEKKIFWIQSTVRMILKDERYTGKMVSNKVCSADIGKNRFTQNAAKEWIVTEGTHEAIISEETFAQARAALASRMKTANKNTNWKYSGNLFICGYCGRKLQKSKEKEPHYYCPKSKYSRDEVCETINEDLQALQNAVVAAIKAMERMMTNAAVMKRKKERNQHQQLKKEIGLLEARKQRIVSDKSRLYESYKNGDITRKQFMELQMARKDKADAIAEEISIREKRITEMEKEERALQTIQNEIQTAELLKSYDPKIISNFVENIRVFEGGRIELVMKNRDAYALLLGKE